METISTEFLTDTQVMRKVIAITKVYLKSLGYEKVITVHCIRGTYHATNCSVYWMTAKQILESATGLSFRSLNGSMARINK